MSKADRPKKEKGWRRIVGELEFLVLDIVDDVLGEYSTEQYEKDFKKLENYIERAKTEAKIEGARAMYCAIHQEGAEVNGDFVIRGGYGKLGELEKETLSNLKKKKK